MSLYTYKLMFLPVVIDAPGDYLTRGGERVTIDHAATNNNIDCSGHYVQCGIKDHWHKSGRIYAGVECQNDIVGKAEPAGASSAEQIGKDTQAGVHHESH